MDPRTRKTQMEAIVEDMMTEVEASKGSWSLHVCTEALKICSAGSVSDVDLFLNMLDSMLMKMSNNLRAVYKIAQMYSLIHNLDIPGTQDFFDKRRVFFSKFALDKSGNVHIANSIMEILNNTLSPPSSYIKRPRSHSIDVAQMSKAGSEIDDNRTNSKF